MLTITTVLAPTASRSNLLAYEAECRDVLKPLLLAIIDNATAAGWDKRIVASNLMLLAAQEIKAGPAPGTGPIPQKGPLSESSKE